MTDKTLALKALEDKWVQSVEEYPEDGLDLRTPTAAKVTDSSENPGSSSPVTYFLDVPEDYDSSIWVFVVPDAMTVLTDRKPSWTMDDPNVLYPDGDRVLPAEEVNALLSEAVAVYDRVVARLVQKGFVAWDGSCADPDEFAEKAADQLAGKYGIEIQEAYEDALEDL